jgi:glycosyltransferase involved in cell wall biosynthesis
MSDTKRLRALISAYACNPAEGSENAVGWRWGMEMAKHHDVTVLTRANNRADIEAAVAKLPAETPRPNFAYHDLGAFLQRVKKIRGLNQWYYLCWQRGARKTVSRLNAATPFDLLHHATYAAYRYRTALDGHGVSVLWGPVGGAERVPWKLLRLDSKWSFFSEATRNLINALQQVPFLGLMPKSAWSEGVLVSTPETEEKLASRGIKATLFPAIGLDLPDSLPLPRKHARGTPLKIIYVGNLLFLKGLHLALEGLADCEFDFHLTIVGDGIYGKTLRRIASRAGLEDKVTFTGRVPMGEVESHLQAADIFLFPSLHDSGGLALIEAMSIGLPAVCLDCGGPAVAVDDTCGIKVIVDTGPSIRQGIAKALRRYADDADLYAQHSAGAIERVHQRYDWRKKGIEMAKHYTSTV